MPCTTETIVENEEVKNSWTDINDISSPETITQELVSKIDALLKDEINFVEIPTEVGANIVFSLISHIIYHYMNGMSVFLSLIFYPFRIWINKSVPLYMNGYVIDIMVFWIQKQLAVQFES